MNDTLKIKAGALIGALSIQKEYLENMSDALVAGVSSRVAFASVKSCNADALRLAEFIRDHINRLETEK